MKTYFRVIHLRKRYLLLALVFAIALVKIGVAAQLDMEQKSISSMSWTVANKTIVIDPGHGGIDPGKISPNGIKEKKINLEIAQKLALVLKQAGAKVLMTRESDVNLGKQGSKEWDHRKDLAERVQLANSNNADLYISVHCNSYPDQSQHGAQVFYQPQSEKSKQLGEAIQGEIANILKNTKRQANGVDYYVTRNTTMPTVIVETGFITNPQEEKQLQDPEYQSQMAWSIYGGIIQYYEGTKKEPLNY